MKNKIPNESIFKKKGFYVALYSCLGAVMVMATVVSFNNLSVVNKPPYLTSKSSVDTGQLKTTSQSNSQSYLMPIDENAEARGAKMNETPQNLPSSKPDVTPEIDKTPGATSVVPPKTNTPTPEATPATGKKNVDETAPKADSSKLKTGELTTDETNESAATEANPMDEATVSTDVTDDTTAKVEPATQTEMSAFTDGGKMAWPVLGEVVMNFSDTHAIYDETLDQYRTNDNICIAAELGAQVLASYDGTVSKVSKTREDGNLVVIDNGNGWTTTYSQLQDGVLVKEGDVVKSGQVIGGVASPSIYGVLLGNHIGFKVAKNDQGVNPLSVLQQ